MSTPTMKFSSNFRWKNFGSFCESFSPSKCDSACALALRVSGFVRLHFLYFITWGYLVIFLFASARIQLLSYIITWGSFYKFIFAGHFENLRLILVRGPAYTGCITAVSAICSRILLSIMGKSGNILDAQFISLFHSHSSVHGPSKLAGQETTDLLTNLHRRSATWKMVLLRLVAAVMVPKISGLPKLENHLLRWWCQSQKHRIWRLSQVVSLPLTRVHDLVVLYPTA